MGLEDTFDVRKPSEHLGGLHSSNVVHQCSGKLFGVNVLFKQGENLVQQLLLMQVVELQGGEHLVHDDVLVNESRELVHDGGDQVGVILETNMNLGARNHLASAVHAHVQLEHSTTYIHSLHGVMNVLVMSHHSEARPAMLFGWRSLLGDICFSLSTIGTNIDSDLLGLGCLEATE